MTMNIVIKGSHPVTANPPRPADADIVAAMDAAWKRRDKAAWNSLITKHNLVLAGRAPAAIVVHAGYALVLDYVPSFPSREGFYAKEVSPDGGVHILTPGTTWWQAGDVALALVGPGKIIMGEGPGPINGWADTFLRLYPKERQRWAAINA